MKSRKHQKYFEITSGNKKLCCPDIRVTNDLLIITKSNIIERYSIVGFIQGSSTSFVVIIIIIVIVIVITAIDRKQLN